MVSLEGSTCQVLHFCRGRPWLDTGKEKVGQKGEKGCAGG